MKRRGFTLVEALIFATIAVILIGSAWHVLTRGMSTGRTAVEGITLQQGVRNLVENMVRDVNGALMIYEPHASSAPVPSNMVVLYLHQNVDPGDRAGLQPGAQQAGTPYPFAATTGPTNYVLPVYQVAYVSDPNARTVIRVVTKGDLLSQSERGGIVNRYVFRPSGASARKVVARELEYFEIWPYVFDPTQRRDEGRPPLVLASEARGQGERRDQTLGIVLRVKANFYPEENIKAAQDSSMEILTTILSYPKLYDTAYRPFFSSVDNDLRY